MDELRVFELWHIPVAVAGPIILVLVLAVIARQGWLGLDGIPRAARAPACFVVASLLTCVMLVILTRPPSQAVSAESVALSDSDVRFPGWPVRVYGFEDWGDRCRQEKVAGIVRRRLTDALVDRQMIVRVGREPTLPTELYENGRKPSERELAPFRALVPFAAITGVVGSNSEDLYEVQVWVHWIDENVRARPLLHKKVSAEDPMEVIPDVVGSIAQVAEDFTGVVPGR